ncbi:RNA polymerase sigma factor [Pedobacter ghigonis]|uniref:RNA polymerase sigma factor n=1 Tax=Pedobacter ghigonis TaxID=2730403 RepID=UPI0015885B7A|nr:RNA polymerase sigma-70 factor [Pedobacter ghigonis]
MTKYNTYTDQLLAQMLREGDRMAYTEIYNRYKRLLYLFAFRRLGEKEEVWDIVHEVFLSLWLNHENLVIEHSLSTYLHAAMRNKVANAIAHKHVSARYLDSFTLYLSSEKDVTDHVVRHHELETLINREINALPAQMRKVFEMSRKNGYNRKQIAELLNLSEETVKAHMYQSLKRLKMKLGSMLSIVFLL